MALANILHSFARNNGDVDGPEHVGSESSTPPGAATPRPDLIDKRSPGILHSYIGQVRQSFRSSIADTAAPPAPRLSPAEAAVAGPMSTAGGLQSDSSPGGGDLPTPPAWSDLDAPSPLLPHEHAAVLPARMGGAHTQTTVSGYPTPPTSSSASSSLAASEKPLLGLDAALAENVSLGAEKLHARHASLEMLPSKLRRHTCAPPPLSSVTTTPAVHASHFALPRSSMSTPASPAREERCFSAQRHSASYRSAASLLSTERKRLTEGGATPPNQSTPPRTPRTLSQDSRISKTTSPIHANFNIIALDEKPKIPGDSSSSAIVRPPKGRLSVLISAGRGLLPSFDPYVVCTFQCNEYISKGPRGDGARASSDDDVRRTASALPMMRTSSDMGRPMAIPMQSRQNSHRSISDASESKTGKQVTDPVWNHDAIFDVVGDETEVDVSVYDHSDQETFLGHVRLCPSLTEDNTIIDEWLNLKPRESEEDHVTGEIHLRIRFQTVDKKHFGPDDFQILKLIGKGTFGQVFQVRKRDTHRVYAMKVLSKKVIVQKKEVAHTLGERNILVRTAMADSPFIVGLKFSFQTPTDLYLVTDYMSGGELFWHLQKEGRFQEDRAKFYIAELILALQHLHRYDIVYRDLKPENILLDANGHIALCDFGLSKANLAKDDTTNTFCGTTEYLAPEVLLDEHGYTKMVDFWSLGVLVFEMCCGWSPFYAEDTQQMYKNIAFGKVRFPRDALSSEGRNFVKGLLNRNPKHRLGAQNDAEELKAHAFFADIDWDALAKKNLVPPFKPRLKSVLDTSNFDPEFTNALNGASSLNARAAALVNANISATPLSPTMQANFKGFTFVDESSMDNQFGRGDDDDDENEDAMDEDDEDTEGETLAPTVSHGDRMSGIFRTDDGDDNMGF